MARRRFMTAVLWCCVASSALAWADEGVGRSPGLPRLLVFGSQGCAPCLRLKPVLDELRERFAGRAEVTYLDLWREGGGQADVEAHGLRALPTLLFFDATGVLRHRLEGYAAKEDLLPLLEDLARGLP